MTHAAEALATAPVGLLSLLDLPVSAGRLSRTLRTGTAVRSARGSEFPIA